MLVVMRLLMLSWSVIWLDFIEVIIVVVWAWYYHVERIFFFLVLEDDIGELFLHIGLSFSGSVGYFSR
ncbi:hypothetical protein, partial [Pseudomonas syringae group genomosp. 7]|uniref:hypothetical protein n=1 Tax=Pseudomonas syringae group genomosp. 7 TaxID=251699 RepID=UPI00376FFFE3